MKKQVLTEVDAERKRAIPTTLTWLGIGLGGLLVIVQLGCAWVIAADPFHWTAIDSARVTAENTLSVAERQEGYHDQLAKLTAQVETMRTEIQSLENRPPLTHHTFNGSANDKRP